MGVTTAAVPHANTSAMSPLAMPSRTSASEMSFSTTLMPSSSSSVISASRVMPSRMVPGEARGLERAVLADDEQVHPAQLLEVRVGRGVGEQHLLAAVLVRLLSAGAATRRSCRRTWRRPCRPGPARWKPCATQIADGLDAAREVRADGRRRSPGSRSCARALRPGTPRTRRCTGAGRASSRRLQGPTRRPRRAAPRSSRGSPRAAARAARAGRR